MPQPPVEETPKTPVISDHEAALLGLLTTADGFVAAGVGVLAGLGWALLAVGLGFAAIAVLFVLDVRSP